MAVSLAVEKVTMWEQGNRELGLEYFLFPWNWEFVLLCPRGLTFANRTENPAEMLQTQGGAFSPAVRCLAGSRRA